MIDFCFCPSEEEFYCSSNSIRVTDCALWEAQVQIFHEQGSNNISPEDLIQHRHALRYQSLKDWGRHCKRNTWKSLSCDQTTDGLSAKLWTESQMGNYWVFTHCEVLGAWRKAKELHGHNTRYDLSQWKSKVWSFISNSESEFEWRTKCHCFSCCEEV